MFLDKGWVDVANFSNSLAKVSAILDLIPPWREVIPSNLRDYGEIFPLAHPPPPAGARSVPSAVRGNCLPFGRRVPPGQLP